MVKSEMSDFFSWFQIVNDRQEYTRNIPDVQGVNHFVNKELKKLLKLKKLLLYRIGRKGAV